MPVMLADASSLAKLFQGRGEMSGICQAPGLIGRWWSGYVLVAWIVVMERQDRVELDFALGHHCSTSKQVCPEALQKYGAIIRADEGLGTQKCVEDGRWDAREVRAFTSFHACHRPPEHSSPRPLHSSLLLPLRIVVKWRGRTSGSPLIRLSGWLFIASSSPNSEIGPWWARHKSVCAFFCGLRLGAYLVDVRIFEAVWRETRVVDFSDIVVWLSA